MRQFVRLLNKKKKREKRMEEKINVMSHKICKTSIHPAHKHTHVHTHKHVYVEQNHQKEIYIEEGKSECEFFIHSSSSSSSHEAIKVTKYGSVQSI
jgi:hypothetical protein